MTRSYTLYDYGDRHDPTPPHPDRVATRRHADEIGRLALRYQAAQPYDPLLVIEDPDGTWSTLDVWLQNHDVQLTIGGDRDA